MAFIQNTDRRKGFNLPTTPAVDVAHIYDVDVKSPEFKQLIVQLYQTLNNTALAVNNKTSGYYLTQQFNTGNLYFEPSSSAIADLRPVYRVVVNFGALPNAGTKSVAHGITITATTAFTNIYATATNPSTSFIPIPYASPTLNENIALNVDATNVNITTGINRTAYTTCYVVLEWITI